LAQAAAHRAIDAEQRARSALTELDHAGTAITFAAVARHAHLSRQFLYSHQALRAEIDALRAPDFSSAAGVPARERASENSLRARLRTALDDNQRLRSELKIVRDELAIALGRNRELDSTASHPCPDLAVRSVLEGSVYPSTPPSGEPAVRGCSP
jgi:hypothetical protein